MNHPKSAYIFRLMTINYVILHPLKIEIVEILASFFEIVENIIFTRAKDAI